MIGAVMLNAMMAIKIVKGIRQKKSEKMLADSGMWIRCNLLSGKGGGDC